MLDRIISRMKDRYSVERTVVIITTSIFFIGCFIFIFNCINTAPSSEQSRAELEERIEFISANPEEMLKGDCKIEIKRGITTYKTENAECHATVKLDQDYKVIEIKLEDKSVSAIAAGVVSLIVSATFSIFAGLACMILVGIVDLIGFELFGRK